MHELAERLLHTIRKEELLRPGDRVAVAVSGGADSVALFLLLLELRAELGIVLSVTHVNHKLRGEESDADEHFVGELARKHELELQSRTAPLEPRRDSGIEATARRLRYEVFRELVRKHAISTVATAHTLDDQAETVLLRILRGTGLRGLAGIHPRLTLPGTEGQVVRPLLGTRRSELETYLRERGQAWREDSSNRDLTFLRNRVRHRVLPLLKENFGSVVADNLADLAEIARAEEEHWKTGHPEAHASANALRVDSLRMLPLAAQRRLVRSWIEHNAPDAAVSFRLIDDTLELASGSAEKKLTLSSGIAIRRSRGELCIESSTSAPSAGYEYVLNVPGVVEVLELGIRIEAHCGSLQRSPECEREQWLDRGQLPKTLVVRNWRPGDRYWPAHSKEPRKVKELLSDRHVTGAEKKLWPVVEAEGLGIVWVRGFPVPQSLRPMAGADPVVWIEESPLANRTNSKTKERIGGAKRAK